MKDDVTSARPQWPDNQEHHTGEDGLSQVIAILDRDRGLMPANREHALWALWEAASGGASSQAEAGDPQALAAFRAAYAAWLAQKPILLK
jgi:hypothetical protein